MQDSSHAFLRSLLETPSPSGYEQPVQALVRTWARAYADEVRTDRHGNVLAVRYPTPHPNPPPQGGRENLTPSPPQGGREHRSPSPLVGEGWGGGAARSEGTPRIMLAGHCDQIGLMVQHIDDNGFLYVLPIGGWDMQILLGQNLTVWTRHGGIPGVVARRAPHLMTNEERNKVPTFQDVWIDIGAKDRKDAEELVRPGDPVTCALGYRPLRNNMAASPGMDDKVGLWTVMEALRLMRDEPLHVAVFCVSTVQEEIGLRGATTSSYGIHPSVGIAVDVTHSTDTPSNDKKQLGDVRLGSGPVLFRGPNINPHVLGLLEVTAKQHEIPVQVRGAPRATGTDANAMQLAHEGVATALVSIPNRYMHSPVEVVHLDDLDHTARLLAEFCLSVTPAMDWTP